jgi:hypothetical protein
MGCFLPGMSISPAIELERRLPLTQAAPLHGQLSHVVPIVYSATTSGVMIASQIRKALRYGHVLWRERVSSGGCDHHVGDGNPSRLAAGCYGQEGPDEIGTHYSIARFLGCLALRSKNSA